MYIVLCLVSVLLLYLTLLEEKKLMKQQVIIAFSMIKGGGIYNWKAIVV